jgi:hypothetical protein
MDFKNIDSRFYPAYTWLWNTTVTKEEIKEQIDEMYNSGIRAFYALGEPENFRPGARNTHLSPEYLSDEYIELIYYAFSYAKEKGMYTWLYNEGGFPSGMACGKITAERPDLVKKIIKSSAHTLSANEPYHPSREILAAFAEGKRVYEGELFSHSTQITEYYVGEVDNKIYSDCGHPDNVKLFINHTHERLFAKFGCHFGNEINYMFDDESFLGSWTHKFDELFKNKFGYDPCDFLTVISGNKEPDSREEHQAKIDYNMLMGEIILKNHFLPMREWLNARGMLSVGHLDNDHMPEQAAMMRYGNTMRLFRAFDIPGVDVIWSQITYPHDGKACYEGNPFFPRLASSAAHQQGHSVALSESFAVYGGHVTPDEMRYVVNYQAVRGISLFNFMVISFARKGILCYQYRPSFIKENPGMDMQGEINGYTARLSYILQNSTPDTKTALFIPHRTICAGGKPKEKAAKSYTEMGLWLEENGVDFDLIDEELVLEGKIEGGTLTVRNITYENVFIPYAEHELPEVIDKILRLNKNVVPSLKRKHSTTLGRKLLLNDGSVAYFITNTAAHTVAEEITFDSPLHLYELDLFDGELYEIPYKRNGNSISVKKDLLCGEGLMLILKKTEVKAKSRPTGVLTCTQTVPCGFATQVHTIDPKCGPVNTPIPYGEGEKFPGEWRKDFSGQVTYKVELGDVIAGDYIVDLGEVRHFARIKLNEELVAEKTMPPYTLMLSLNPGDTITVEVSNTVANACLNAEIFERYEQADIGPYHSKMKIREEKAMPGGFIGPIRISKITK